MRRLNRNYARLVDGSPEFLSLPIVTEQGDLFTNNAAVLLEHGFLPVVREPMPEPIEGYNYVAEWTVSDSAIIQTWAAVLDEVSE